VKDATTPSSDQAETSGAATPSNNSPIEGDAGQERAWSERSSIVLLAALSATTALGIDLALPAFSDIRADLGLAPDSNRVALTVTVYFLGMAGAQTLYGPFADRYGRKPVLAVGLTLYLVGALASALAPGFGWLVAARFVWGVGAAGPRALSLAIGRDLYSGERLARILAVVAAVFMVVPALAPLIGQGVLAIGSWRWVLAAPVLPVVVLLAWLARFPEPLAPERRRPLTWGRTGEAFRAVVADRVTLGSTLAIMFEMGAFMSFLGSSQLLFDDVYDRGDQFALWFAGMSVVMGIVVFVGSRQVDRWGVERVIGLLLPVSLALSFVVVVWSLATDGRPVFLGWFVLVTVINASRTLINSLLQARAMQPMGELAGTAAAVIGTISFGGGAFLAGVVDRMVDGSVTPLAVAYAGYGLASLVLARWARPGSVAGGQRPSVSS
jgi:DHA1 family bicyclomycin/chloramphenicol resistance-like MFS transporter